MSVQISGKLDRISLFFDNLTPQTKKCYEYHIPLVIGQDFQGFVSKALENPDWAEAYLLRWIADKKNEKKLSAQSIQTYIRSTLPLLKFTKVKIDYDTIKDALPKKNKPKNTVPTLQQVRKLYENCDVRGKFIVSLMVSGGFRVGAFDYFTLKDLQQVKDMKIGRLLVYRGEPEEYVCYVSGEAMQNFENYLETRKNVGEKLTPDSPLIRNIFSAIRDYNPSTDVVEKASANSIQQWLMDAWAKVLETRSFKQAHFSRAFFKTMLEDSEMKTGYVELLMGHATQYGNELAYNKPNEQKLAEIYSKYAKLLTISETVELTEKLTKVEKEKSALEDIHYVRSKRLEDDLGGANQEIAVLKREKTALEETMRDAIRRITELENKE